MVGTTGSRACDCVEVYLQSSGQRVFKMTFHHSMSFKQIVLVGQETQRALLLLTGVAQSSGCKLLSTDSSGQDVLQGRGRALTWVLHAPSSCSQTQELCFLSAS